MADTAAIVYDVETAIELVIHLKVQTLHEQTLNSIAPQLSIFQVSYDSI